MRSDDSRDTFDPIGLAAWRVLKDVVRERKALKDPRADELAGKSREETPKEGIVRGLETPEPVDAARAANGNGRPRDARKPRE